MRIAIIGAGPAGITAAYELAKAGTYVTVFEAGPYVGGLARSFDLWGQRVDLGPHRFFSNDTRVNRLWLEVAGKDYRMVDRLTRIYYAGKFYDYPLKAVNALVNMGPLQATACMVSYLRQKFGSSPDDNEETFEDWVVSRFGRRLFEMFFKSYSEKLWGISCEDLDADFAAQRIKKFSLGEAVLAALGFGSRKHKTLVDQFAFPIEGTGMVYERMAAYVLDHGGDVRLSTPVQGVECRQSCVTGIRLPCGHTEPFDHVISTMPLTLMVKSLGELPPEVAQSIDGLTYRNTIVIYLHVDGIDLFSDQWLYIHSPDLAFGRLTNFRNWVPQLYGQCTTTILALEYWCYDTDEIWTHSDQDLIRLARREVAATGLLKGAAVIDGHVCRIPRCYPVYGRNYKQKLTPIIDYLKTIQGVTPIGRYGAFKYKNQDHSILMGLLAADNLLRGTQHDLWAVNTDYESYQESSTIGESGLVAETR